MPNQSQQNTLDPQLVNLTKAIRQTESGGNFQAQGASGEYGAYQWLPSTWAAKSTAAGVDVPLNQATPEQQNEVAYKTLASWKQQHPDWNIGNFASAWNAGEGAPNAYQGNAGTNAEGVKYDTAAYAQKVAQAYHQFKSQSGQGSGFSVTPLNIPSSLQAGSDQQPQETFTGDLAQGNYGGALLKGAENTGNFLFPIGGDISNDVQGKSNKNVVQQIADAALSALPFIPFAGEAGEAIRGAGLAGQVGLGAAAGGLQGISQGQNAQGILTSAALGGVTGGALSGAGSLLSKLSDTLPSSFVRKFIPGLSEEEANYAASKPLGSLGTMLEDSNSRKAQLGAQLGAALKNPQYDYVQPSTGEMMQNIINSQTLADSGLNPEEIGAKLKSILPLKGNLIDQFMSGEDMSLTDLHKLNSALGQATFKRVFDDPTVRAGKDVGSAVYHEISNVLKQSSPESAPLFDDLSKEYALNAGLQKATRSVSKSRTIGLREIVAMMAGMGVGGPAGGIVGGLGMAGVEKVLRSPSINLKAAGLISRLGSPTASKIGQGLVPLASRVPSLVSGLINP